MADDIGQETQEATSQGSQAQPKKDKPMTLGRILHASALPGSDVELFSKRPDFRMGPDWGKGLEETRT